MSIPLGDSIFQIQHFILKDLPPGRQIRTCQLQLRKKLQAMEEYSFNRRLLEINRLEIIEKLEGVNGYEKDRLQVELDKLNYALNSEQNLIEDCLTEIAVYESVLNSLPEMSREEFEIEERSYWTKRLLNDARREFLSMGTVSVGTLTSLENIGIEVKRDEQGLLTYEIQKAAISNN